jgi:23S rRNA (cytidine1920-2'-O)/16S rRNA (cytidine1409-2'-O)-methyltransferase
VTSRQRLDQALVARGLMESRARAQEAIAAGLVTVDGAPATKPAQRVDASAVLAATPAHPYVSRGALKLIAALDAFAIDPSGRHCLDVGASTGGFTEVLLRRGAAHVSAIDVGRGQLHPTLAADPRVTSREGTDIRTVTAERLGTPVTLAVADVSFISLRLVLPAIAGLIAPGAPLVALIKPQFEVGPGRIGKGGIVSDEQGLTDAIAGVREAATAAGFAVGAVIPSPITGGDGNREFLLSAIRRP